MDQQQSLYIYIYIYISKEDDLGIIIFQIVQSVGVRPPNECPGYAIKQSNADVSVMLGLWGIRSTPSLAFHIDQLWPGMVATDRALGLSMG